MPVIIDTNVLIIANGRTTTHLPPPGCTVAAARRLLEIQASEIVVLDDKWLLIREYQKKQLRSGQNKVGDAFLLWLLQNRTNSSKCREVPVTVLDEQKQEYEPFPTDPTLAGFDPSDRKFVAVALSHGANYAGEIPQIVNATDSDWVNYEAALAPHGITIEFLCGKELKTS